MSGLKHSWVGTQTPETVRLAFRGWHEGLFELKLQQMNYSEIITLEPGKRGGKPCIRGMRITVYDVLSYLASGMTHEEILLDFPYITEADIRACLSYAADREQFSLNAS